MCECMIFLWAIVPEINYSRIFFIYSVAIYFQERGFPEDVCQVIEMLVPATRVLWQKVKNKMLPTPTKFHYVFNLRDLSRIWQGMLVGEADVVNTTEVFVYLN